SAAIKGRADVQLSGDYSGKGDLTFERVTWANLAPLVSDAAPGVDASTSGSVTFDGPLAKPDQLTGLVRLASLELHQTNPGTKATHLLMLENQGDIEVRVEKGVAQIQSAHFRGPQSDITAAGSASIRGDRLDLRFDGNVNLALLSTFNNEIRSSGLIVLS